MSDTPRAEQWIWPLDMIAAIKVEGPAEKPDSVGIYIRFEEPGGSTGATAKGNVFLSIPTPFIKYEGEKARLFLGILRTAGYVIQDGGLA